MSKISEEKISNFKVETVKHLVDDNSFKPITNIDIDYYIGR